jgi:hypothetical protein
MSKREQAKKKDKKSKAEKANLVTGLGLVKD